MISPCGSCAAGDAGVPWLLPKNNPATAKETAARASLHALWWQRLDCFCGTFMMGAKSRCGALFFILYVWRFAAIKGSRVSGLVLTGPESNRLYLQTPT